MASIQIFAQAEENILSLSLYSVTGYAIMDKAPSITAPGFGYSYRGENNSPKVSPLLPLFLTDTISKT